jgi:hypothetical protein
MVSTVLMQLQKLTTLTCQASTDQEQSLSTPERSLSPDTEEGGRSRDSASPGLQADEGISRRLTRPHVVSDDLPGGGPVASTGPNCNLNGLEKVALQQVITSTSKNADTLLRGLRQFCVDIEQEGWAPRWQNFAELKDWLGVTEVPPLPPPSLPS